MVCLPDAGHAVGLDRQPHGVGWNPTFGVVVAEFAYLANSFATLVFPKYAPLVSQFASPLQIVELPVVLWLPVWGSKTQNCHQVRLERLTLVNDRIGGRLVRHRLSRRSNELEQLMQHAEPNFDVGDRIWTAVIAVSSIDSSLAPVLI